MKIKNILSAHPTADIWKSEFRIANKFVSVSKNETRNIYIYIYIYMCM